MGNIMKTAFALAAAAASVSAITVEESHIARFNIWKGEHSKVYASIEEEQARIEVFLRNHKTIEAHNSDSTQTFTMGHNEFSDMTPEEFKSTMTGYTGMMGRSSGADSVHTQVGGEDAAKDWRSEGKVTEVKNQGQCGSCWAFSTTGSTESANLIKNGGSASDPANQLSEQQLVDCSKANQGCNGGLMDYGFTYLKGLGASGDDTESSYPYTAKNGRCHADTGVASNIRVTGYTDVARSEAALRNAVGTVGPVSIAIEADQRAFQFYNGGVLTKGCGQRLDHGVLLVGYGTENSQDYWIVKNSWGPSWGEQGYIRIAQGSNLCGLSNQASYPHVA